LDHEIEVVAHHREFADAALDLLERRQDSKQTHRYLVLVATSRIALACVEADFTLYRGVAIKTALCASQIRGASHESFEVEHMAGMFTE
jgi:hypothetical protein